MFQDSDQRVVDEGTQHLAALEKIDGMITHHAVGFNGSVGAVTFETIWDVGGLYVYMTTAALLDVQSTDVNDTLGGTGAQSVRIYGLDENWAMIQEDVDLDGTTTVNTVNKFIRVFRMAVPAKFDISGVSITKDAIGTITAEDGGNVQAQIVGSVNATLMSIFTVPAGYTGLLLFGSASVGKAKEATIHFVSREFGGVFQLAYPDFLYERDTQRPFVIPFRVNEKTDVEVRGKADVAGVEMGANFDILLVRN